MGDEKLDGRESQGLTGFWQFLNTDVREIPWGELAEKGVETVTTSAGFAEKFGEQAPQIKQLKPYIEEVEPFLKILESPVTQLAIAGLPFVSVGIGLLRIYLSMAKVEPTFEGSVAIAAQLAYLQSLEGVLKRACGKVLAAKLEQVSLKGLVERQLARLEETKLSADEAKKVTSRFRESALAAAFGGALAAQLAEVGLSETQTRRLVEQVGWGTHRYLHQAIAEAGESVEPLAEFYRVGGQQVQERYESIRAYLEEAITKLPQERVFDEKNPRIEFKDIYVPLEVQPLTQGGDKQRDFRPINSHAWVRKLLEKDYENDEPRKVLFLQGDAGRGKSVFCRMLANWVRQEMPFSYIPIVIRLRNIRVLANNLTETLEDCPDLEQVSFVRGEADWLADRNTRFLLILDGFDELLLQDRATGGLKEFLQQVADFQAHSHHQCLVTGRPLALLGVERLITQTKNLERAQLEPMSDSLRERWLENWRAIFGEAELKQFREFIEACPNEIGNNLAREPLLLYLLGRLHREKHLTSGMFADTDQQIQAKLRVYRESVNWVLEKQRQDENLRLAGLDDMEDLREILREAALCVVQSGNETARLEMLKNRFQDTANPVAELLKQSRQTTGQNEDKALNNLLTTFYLKPGKGDKRGSVEFAHKSFSEYLFAERLIVAFEDWTEVDKRNRPKLDDRAVNGQIYDLLGYDGLSVETVEYLFELLQESELNPVRLFERLHNFYLRWCEGEFLDHPPTENLPQKKMLQIRRQGVPISLNQVDIFAGLNIMIVLFKLHAAAQPEGYPYLLESEPKPNVYFHPCRKPEPESFDPVKLLKIVHYTDTLGIGIFARVAGPHLSRASFSRANLFNADFFHANLESADLFGTNLDGANLSSANLSGADLSESRLFSANFYGANLSSANLSDAYLLNINFYNSNLDKVSLSGASLYNVNVDNVTFDGADFGNSILFNIDFRYTNNLSAQQFTGEALPFLCNAVLPEEINIDKDRDWHRLPPALSKRYPEEFKTLEEAERFVSWRQQAN